MSTRILIFNIVFYGVTLLLLSLGREDSSSSLGYGFFILGFWILAVIVLVFFLRRKILLPGSVPEKIGIFTATPILSILCVWLILTVNEDVSSEWYFNNGRHRYKVRTIKFKQTSGVKRIEFYRNRVNATPADEGWVRDSTWIYFSEAGYTIRKQRYKNDVEVK